MNRAALLTYLTNKFNKLAADTGVTNDDTNTGYANVIDSTLYALGFTSSQLASATIPDAKTLAAQAIADYYALSLYAAQFAPRTDIAYDERAVNRLDSKATIAIERQMKAALERAQMYGYLRREIKALRYMLDYLEAESAENA